MSELFAIFLNILTPIFALIGVGYLAGPRLGLEVRTLSKLAYFVLTPVFVFNILSQARFDPGTALRMVLFIWAVFAGSGLVGYGLGRLLGRPREMVAAYVLVAAFANVGNFGLPIIQFRLGEEGLVAATILFVGSNFISFVLGVGAASWAKGRGLGALMAVLKTPALVVVPPALLVNWLWGGLPLALDRPVSLLAGAMIPVMLVTLGVQLAGMGLPKITLDVVMASAGRLVGGPILAILLAAPLGLTGVPRGAGILQASMPAAVLASLIALEHDLLPDFVTTTVLFSTLASYVTLAVILAFV